MVVGLAGALITATALPFSSARMTIGRGLLALSLMLLHVAASIGYFLYAQHNPADANGYYLDTYHLASAQFGFGGVFTTKLTQVLKNTFGGSFLECFIFFQGIGFWGVMILMRTFQEIHSKMRAGETIIPAYLLFLPSIHFWTSAIGKDAPLFFAVSLCVWSMLNWRKRGVTFALALCVMVLFRPHIALIAVLSIAAAAVLHAPMSLGRRAILLTLTFGGAVVLAQSVQSTLNVDVTSAGSVATFLQHRSDIGAKIGGDAANAPLVVRLFSLLFRPMFFEAAGLMGAIASLENMGSAILALYFLKNWRRIRFLAARVFFVEYCAVFAVTLTVLLALVYYNVGLGLRERVMIFPPLLSVFVACWAMPRINSVTAGARGHSRTLMRRQPATPFSEAQL